MLKLHIHTIEEVITLLKPLGDRVVIELVESEEKTASGIVLPDSAKKNRKKAKSWRLVQVAC